MKTTTVRFGALASLILVSSLVYGQNGGLRFALTDLGTFGGYQSEAWAINNSGQIVGDYLWTFKRLSGQGCFSKKNGQAAVTFGSAMCTARAVNANGAVAGWMSVGSPTHAFRFDPSGNLYDLPPLTNDGDSHGYGIDYYGRVVGDGTVDAFYVSSALQWDLGGHPTIWGCPSAHANSAAFATNSAGNILAGICQEDLPYWWYLGAPLPLSSLSPRCADPDDTPAIVLAINNGNYMAGYGVKGDCTTPHAVLWNHGAVDLGPDSVAYAISNDNWIVGTWAGHGFLRVSDTNCPQMANLNSLLDSSGTGWSVMAAYGINDSHQIVGQGLAPNGQYHAILLTPANNWPLCKPD
jgi:uncharacterized membrane protein